MKVTEERPFQILDETALRKIRESYLIVGWAEDAGDLGVSVVDHLRRKLGAVEFAQIHLPRFFPLGGVSVEDDIVQFPEATFYVCPEKDLVLFKGNSPRSEWHLFLKTILQVGQEFCHMKEVYTIGGIISLSAHTAPRQLLTVANNPETRALLQEYDLASDMSYETPPNQRPTLNSYLLWVARNSQVPAISLWVPTPFYLVSARDPQACKKVIEFFNLRFDLGIDLGELDEEIQGQNEQISRVMERVPEIEHYIWKLGRNLALTEDESQKLVKEVEEELGPS